MKKLSPGYRVEIDRVGHQQWSEVVQRFSDATIYQTFSYGAVRWGQKNLSHLVLKKNGEVVAAAQSRILEIPPLPLGIAFIRWGPLWRVQRRTADLRDLRQMIRALRMEYVERRGLYLRVLPNIFTNDPFADEIRSAFESEGITWVASPYRTILLDLGHSLRQLEKNLTARWRRQLNIARRKSLKLIEGKGGELFQAFRKPYNEMLARKKFEPGMNLDDYVAMQRELPDPFQMTVLLCLSEGEVVAGLIGSSVGDVGIYLFGATSDNGLKLRGSYLLQWQMIERFKGQGVCRYDLNGYDPDKNPGTATFKLGLGGWDVRQLGQFEACENKINYLFIKPLERIKNFANGPMFGRRAWLIANRANFILMVAILTTGGFMALVRDILILSSKST